MIAPYESVGRLLLLGAEHRERSPRAPFTRWTISLVGRLLFARFALHRTASKADVSDIRFGFRFEFSLWTQPLALASQLDFRSVRGASTSRSRRLANSATSLMRCVA